MRRHYKQKVYLIPPAPTGRSETDSSKAQALTPLGRSTISKKPQINAEVVVPTKKIKRKGTVIVSDSEDEEESSTSQPKHKLSKVSASIDVTSFDSPGDWMGEELHNSQIDNEYEEIDPVQAQAELKLLVSQIKKEIKRLDAMSRDLESKVNVICHHLKSSIEPPSATSTTLQLGSTRKGFDNIKDHTSEKDDYVKSPILQREGPMNLGETKIRPEFTLELPESEALPSSFVAKQCTSSNESDVQFIQIAETQLGTNSFQAQMKSAAYGRALDYKHREVNCIAVCSENGEVKLWNASTREIVTHIPENVLQKNPQDLCFVSSSVLAVGYEENHIDHSYLSFIHFLSVEKNKILIRVQHFDTEDKLERISTMASISRSQLEYTFGSGGRDGIVRLWRFESPQDYAEDARLHSLTIAHNEHKGSVNSLHYSPSRGVLLSGADDGKLIVYSMNSAAVVNEFQYAKDVISVTANPRNGNLFLACLEAKSEQLNICDYRTKQPADQSFGIYQTQLLSRNVEPSFDPTGNLVACGDGDGAIHIWDLRYLKQGSQMIPVHDSTTYSTLFHPDQDIIFSTSADGALGFTDYCNNL